MIELKPCPFCGGTDVRLIPTGIGAPPRWCVICRGCHTEGPVDLGESGAVEQWNTRPKETELHNACVGIINNTKCWGKYPVVMQITQEAYDACAVATYEPVKMSDEDEAEFRALFCAEPTPPAEELHT